VPGYKTLLAAGGSETPDDLLAPLGIDTRDPAFWQLGFNEVRRLVDWAHQLAS
jgi:oligoendopeptidase F